MSRPEIQELKNKMSGTDVFIIGGGPSLARFDFSLLKNKNTIALNSSFESLENPTAIYWADHDWASKNMEKLDKVNCLKFSSRQNAQEYVKNNIKGFGGCTILNRISDFGLSSNEDEICGNNSGALALNLAVNIKPYRIILLGYDMKFIDGKTHHHAGYEIADAMVYENLFIPSINSMSESIKKLGIDVINCSLESRLNCFRKDKIENYL